MDFTVLPPPLCPPQRATSKVGTVLRLCSRVDEAPRLPLSNTTTHLPCAAGDGHVVVGSRAARTPAAKRKATPADSELAVLRPCSRGDGASRSPVGSTARLRISNAADEHASASVASASPPPPSSDSGGTVRELLATARASTDAVRRREIERLRAASRRELNRMVRTVEFNDPFVSPQDVLR